MKTKLIAILFYRPNLKFTWRCRSMVAETRAVSYRLWGFAPVGDSEAFPQRKVSSRQQTQQERILRHSMVKKFAWRFFRNLKLYFIIFSRNDNLERWNRSVRPKRYYLAQRKSACRNAKATNRISCDQCAEKWRKYAWNKELVIKDTV